MTTTSFFLNTCAGTFRLTPRRAGFYLTLHASDGGSFENLGFHPTAEGAALAVGAQRSGSAAWDSLPAAPEEAGELASWGKSTTAIATSSANRVS